MLGNEYAKKEDGEKGGQRKTKRSRDARNHGLPCRRWSSRKSRINCRGWERLVWVVVQGGRKGGKGEEQ